MDIIISSNNRHKRKIQRKKMHYSLRNRQTDKACLKNSAGVY